MDMERQLSFTCKESWLCIKSTKGDTDILLKGSGGGSAAFKLSNDEIIEIRDFLTQLLRDEELKIERSKF